MKAATHSHPHALAKVLKRLMLEYRVDDASLSEATQVPFTTIARMRANARSNPTVSSLRPLAEYFGVSVSQLLGDHPLPLGGEERAFNDPCYRFPLVLWQDVLSWVNHTSATGGATHHWVVTQLALSPGSFATKVENCAYLSPFVPGSVLMVDPAVQPVSGDVVLVQTHLGGDVTLKEMLLDGAHAYLRALHPEFKEILPLCAADRVCGVVMEARQQLHDKSGTKRKAGIESELHETQPMIEMTA